MYEHKRQMLLPRHEFARRVAGHFGAVAAAIAVALGAGVGGYHYLGRLGWLDSLVNASMILGGMGPVDPIPTKSGKLFASFYALFSGLFFIGAATVLAGPFVHRLLHELHIEDKKMADDD